MADGDAGFDFSLTEFRLTKTGSAFGAGSGIGLRQFAGLDPDSEGIKSGGYLVVVLLDDFFNGKICVMNVGFGVNDHIRWWIRLCSARREEDGCFAGFRIPIGMFEMVVSRAKSTGLPPDGFVFRQGAAGKLCRRTVVLLPPGRSQALV